MKLRRVRISCDKIFLKINHEIKIFNKLNIVLPCKHGVAVAYIENLDMLCRNPKWRTESIDPVSRLFYLLAAANLFNMSVDHFIKKQLLKNLLYIFSSGNLKNNISCAKTYKPRRDRRYYATKQPLFKLLRGESYSKFALKNEKIRFERSYSVTCDGDAIIKNWVDRKLPFECYEIKTNASYKFTQKLVGDKMKWTLTHTADTFYCVTEGRAVAVCVQSKKTFTSNLAQRGDELEVYVNLEKGGNVYVAYGKTKKDVMAIATEIRRGKTSYLVGCDEGAENEAIERLYAKAYQSRFVTGEKLCERFAAATRYVPTLYLPTLVYTVETADDFFAVVDTFPRFREIARACGNLNVVVLYSSLNDVARAHIEAFLDKAFAKTLIDCGVFLFFIDRVTVPNEAVYYLSKMKDNNVPPAKSLSANKCNVEVVVGNKFPITYSIITSNLSSRAVQEKVTVPLCFDTSSVAMIKAGRLVVQSLRGTRANSYKLPTGAIVIGNGHEINNNETVCTGVRVVFEVKLAGYEQKTFEIIKNENMQTVAERKAAFIGSISCVTVKAENKLLTKILALPVEKGCDPVFLKNLCLAVRQADRSLFFALFDGKENLCEDAYAFILSKVIGLRLVRGKVQLLPLVLISGNFELSFFHKDKPYHFSIRERNNGFVITHNNTHYNDFAQISV